MLVNILFDILKIISIWREGLKTDIELKKRNQIKIENISPWDSQVNPYILILVALI